MDDRKPIVDIQPMSMHPTQRTQRQHLRTQVAQATQEKSAIKHAMNAIRRTQVTEATQQPKLNTIQYNTIIAFVERYLRSVQER